MKQKLEDLKLLLQNDKRVWAAGAFIVAVLFIWVLTDQSPRRVRQPEERVSKQGTGADEGFGDLIQAFKQDMDRAKTEQAEQAAVISRVKQDLKDNTERTAGIFESLVDRVDQLSREIDLLAGSIRPQQPDTPITKTKDEEGPDTIEKLWEEPAPLPPPPEPPRPTHVSVISPGDFADVQLLTGVNAPVDGTPYPVVFQLSGPITGPDGSSLDLGEGRIVAAAQGSEVDSRALFRLSSLSIRHPSGRRDVIKVDGWIVGEDGIRGMSGRLIDKLGRLILATAGVSFAAALGDRLTGNSGRNSYDNSRDPGFYAQPKDFDYAAVSALTDSSNRLGKLLLDRYESFVPVVEVLSSREAVAIFSQTSEVSILDDDGDGEGGLLEAGFDE
ncbi:MAG: TrbI/VirB10 family protein [Bdellovibrionota bacterium]